MKIALIEPFSEESGVGEFSKGLYSTLEERDDFERVHLYENKEGLPFLNNTLRIYYFFRKRLRQLESEFDHVFIPSHIWIAGLKPEKYDVEISVMVHDIEIHLEKEGNILQKFNTKRALERTTRCDYVFVPSESTRLDILRTTELNPDDIHVIGEGVKKIKNRKKIETPEEYLLYVGDFQARKNVRTLVKAYDKYRNEGGDKKFVTAGRIYDKNDKEIIKNMLEDLDLQNEFIILGEVSKPELAYLYENAEGYIHPAYYEGFGRTPVEASLYEIPIVVIRQTAPSEFLEEGMKVEPTVKGLSRAMHDIREDFVVEKDFSWEKVVDKFVEVIK